MSRSVVVVCAVVFGGLYLGAVAVLGTPPDAGSSTQAVNAWLGSHASHIRLSVWLLVIGLPFFCGSAAAIRSQLPDGLRDVFFAGAVGFVVETAIQCWVWGALAFSPSPSRQGSSVLLDLALYWGPVLTSATLAMLAPIAAVGLRRQGWPVWAGVIAAVAVVEQAVESLTVFGRHGFVAPGGGMNADLGAAVTAVALIAAVVVVVRRRAEPAV
jgi:hypothetical protein